MNISSILKKIFPEPLGPVSENLTDELAASFFPADSTRLAHMRQACKTARRLVEQMDYDAETAEKIVTAALFHDVGYSEKLKKTGFHPLDGAAYLAHCNAPEDVIRAVLWHSSTPVEIESLPEIKKIYDNFPGPDYESPIHKAVAYCDFRTSPLGESYSFGQRIVELEGRFGMDSLPPSIARKTLPYTRRNQQDYARTIACAQDKNLPWIFCDIDNTLITPGKTIDRRTLNAINRYTTAGGHFSLITGKHMISLPHLVSSVGSFTPHAGVNGSVIVRNGKLEVFGEGVTPFKAIEDALIDAGVHYATYVSDGIWTRTELTEGEIDDFIKVGEVLPQKGETPEEKGAIKILTFSRRDQTEQCDLVRSLAEKHGMSCVRTGEHFLEIGPAGHGKHSAMMQIMEEAGWSDLNSIAIGDSENDLTMFGHVGLSAVVANAAPEALPAADLCIPACEEYGVARLLDALVDSAQDGCWSIPHNWLAVQE
ncbi:HAD-IIB family hydrolase [Desulfovibrio sp. JC010]|uniref:HAD-IIB family hydrolase n=1 Tax=Desulfovibrio sp. JC010 TaxID=2593641 RepID=UPI0013D529DE|nr:HAD-IIB family hydrolase [Desulfovibrio sp. JC010]NDV25825.1 HAD-IIB family hydrolase [Desulfovibrio sp. JC010]